MVDQRCIHLKPLGNGTMYCARDNTPRIYSCYADNKKGYEVQSCYEESEEVKIMNKGW